MAVAGDVPASAGRGAPVPQPLAVMRSPAYLRLLALAVALGVPIAVVAFGFLQLTESLRRWAFTDLPTAVGFASPPLGPLAVAGLIVGLTVRYLPGRGGESSVPRRR